MAYGNFPNGTVIESGRINIPVTDVPIGIGVLKVRVKATTNNNAGIAVSNSMAFTTSLVTDKKLVFDGDSLTLNNGFIADPSYPEYVSTLLDGSYSIQNFAVGGQTSLAANSDATTQIDPAYDNNKIQNVLVLWIGINDLAAATPDITAMRNAITAYVQGRVTKGYKVILLTLTGTRGVSLTARHNEIELNRLSQNRWLRNNYATLGAKYLVDIATDTRIGLHYSPLNSTYFATDLIHMKGTGRSIVAGLVKDAIDLTVGGQTGQITVANTTNQDTTGYTVINHSHADILYPVGTWIIPGGSVSRTSVSANATYKTTQATSRFKIRGPKANNFSDFIVKINGTEVLGGSHYSPTTVNGSIIWDSGAMPSAVYTLEVVALNYDSLPIGVQDILYIASQPIDPSTTGYTMIDSTSISVTKTGTWTTLTNGTLGLDGGSAAYSSTTDAKYSFSFTGSRFKIRSYKDVQLGGFSVWVDGVEKGIGTGYNSTQQTAQIVFDSGDLSQGPHTVEVRRINNGTKYLMFDSIYYLP